MKEQKGRISIDPTVDCVFKAILGDVHHKPLLIHFLNAVLALEGEDRITRIEIANPFTLPIADWAKGPVVDIRAEDQLERQFQIEIQKKHHESLIGRMVYNWSGIYYKLLPKGGDYKQLRPVISIWLMLEDLWPNEQREELKFEILCAQAGKALSDHLVFHVFQLSKLEKGATLTDKQRWLRFFSEGKNLDLDRPPAWMQTPEMQRVVAIMRGFTERDKRLIVYQSRMDYERTQLTIRNELAEAKKIRAENERVAAENEKLRAAKQEMDDKNSRMKAFLEKQGFNPDEI